MYTSPDDVGDRARADNPSGGVDDLNYVAARTLHNDKAAVVLVASPESPRRRFSCFALEQEWLPSGWPALAFITPVMVPVDCAAANVTGVLANTSNEAKTTATIRGAHGNLPDSATIGPFLSGVKGL